MDVNSGGQLNTTKKQSLLETKALKTPLETSEEDEEDDSDDDSSGGEDSNGKADSVSKATTLETGGEDAKLHSKLV